jgi:hypothetical protein
MTRVRTQSIIVSRVGDKYVANYKGYARPGSTKAIAVKRLRKYYKEATSQPIPVGTRALDYRYSPPKR